MSAPTICLEPHQEIVRDFIIANDYTGIFLDIGGGKTLTVLQSLYDIRPAGHILVVAPQTIARSTWINEIEKWGFPLRTRSLIVNERDKKLTKQKRHAIYEEIFDSPPTMYFISVGLIKDLVEAMPIGTDQTTGQKCIRWPFPTVIADESQELKNPSSTRFKALRKVRPAISRFIELTGTPSPQGPIDLWSQIYLLDQGQSLGTTMTEYRQRYFRPVMHVNNRPVKWEPLEGAETEIHSRINHLVMSVDNVSIPKPNVSVDDVSVVLPRDVREAYRDFKREQVLDMLVADSNGNQTLTIVADNAAILRNKLLQFASGTIYTGDDHDRDFAVVHEEKVALCDHLIKQAGSPVIIAYRYRSDKAVLLKELAKEGHQVEAFDGSRDMVAKWNAGAIPVMLLQPASARHGLNLQDGGHTLIWYTLPDSLEHYSQTNGRLARMGQQNPVQIWRLLTQGTFDDRMPALLEKKQMSQDDLIEAVKIDILTDTDDIEDLIGDLDINPL